MASKTVIEAARRAAGLSQRRLAEIARTQQSSISEYERRRKSPTLDVVERLLDAADHELVAKPRVFWQRVEAPDVGSFWVPDKLWSVPLPKCFATVQAFKYVFPDEATGDWQPLIDDATKTQDGPPLDPGAVSEWMAGELRLRWPLPKRWRGPVPRS